MVAAMKSKEGRKRGCLGGLWKRDSSKPGVVQRMERSKEPKPVKTIPTPATDWVIIRRRAGAGKKRGGGAIQSVVSFDGKEVGEGGGSGGQSHWS